MELKITQGNGSSSLKGQNPFIGTINEIIIAIMRRGLCKNGEADLSLANMYLTT